MAIFTRVHPWTLSGPRARPGGRPGIGISASIRMQPLLQFEQRLQLGIPQAQNDPNIVIPLVKSFGRATLQNFNAEKWPGGWSSNKWADLTDYTQAVREERGYRGAWPILNQSGQLREMTTYPFSQWRKGQQSIRGRRSVAPYNSDAVLTMTANISSGVFHASISGSRVSHQSALAFRSRSGDRVGVPPRPFWGLTPDVFEDGMPGVVDNFWRAFWNKS